MRQAERGEPLHSRYAKDRVIRPLLADFVADLPKILEALDRERQLLNVGEVARLAHKLKGEAATYGYPELAESAARLEEFANTQSPSVDSLDNAVATLKGMTRRAEDGLHD